MITIDHDLVRSSLRVRDDGVGWALCLRGFGRRIVVSPLSVRAQKILSSSENDRSGRGYHLGCVRIAAKEQHVSSLSGVAGGSVR
jgi:hypothetical protein